MQQYQPRKDLSDTSRCRAWKYLWPFLGGNRRRKQVEVFLPPTRSTNFCLDRESKKFQTNPASVGGDAGASRGVAGLQRNHYPEFI